MQTPQQIIYESRKWKALEKNINALIEYIEEKKIPNPPQETKYKGISIGMFLTGLRAGGYDRLTPEIKKQLEKLGTNFTPTRKQGAWTYYD